MKTRQILLFTLTFLAAALTAAAVVLLLRRTGQTSVHIDVPPQSIEGPDRTSATSAGATSAARRATWHDSGENSDSWWGVR